MSRGVKLTLGKTTPFKRGPVTFGGSGVSIGPGFLGLFVFFFGSRNFSMEVGRVCLKENPQTKNY